MKTMLWECSMAKSMFNPPMTLNVVIKKQFN
jgi:hypothetical protein